MLVSTLESPSAAVTLRFPKKSRLSDDAFWAFCVANPDLRIERTAEGEIVIVPPAGSESDYRCLRVAAQLLNWAEEDGRGRAFGPTVLFLLPDGSGLSPDAAWVSSESLSRLTKQERKKFLRLTPEFVVEVMSPSDTLREAKAKMELWIANGVQLAWLIDADARTVHVYRPRSVKTRKAVAELAGEGPVKGFALKLAAIWAGL